MEFAISVIVISILALVVMPRISQLQIYARIVKLKTLRASVISASTIVHGAVMVRSGKIDSKACRGGSSVANNFEGTMGTLCMEKGIVNLVYGYPAVTGFEKAGILSVAGLTQVFNPTAAQVQARGYGYIKTGKVATFQVIGGSDASNCFFTYIEATANSAPIVSVVITTGC